MYCVVTLSGYLSKETINGKFREVIVEMLPVRERDIITDKIPITYWNPSPRSRLFTLKEGTLVMITGRLHRDEEIGLYVMAERVEYIASPGELVTTIM